MDIERLLNNDMSDTSSPMDLITDASESPLRAGKWTVEEMRYATALVRHFVAGTLTIPSGTSLRGFLARKLHCSTMRISTKLATDALGGFKSTKKLGLKRFFPMEGLSIGQRDQVARELQRLRADFVRVANLSELDNDEPTTRYSLSSTASSSSMDEEDETDAPSRVGSWSHEEQVYACALIDGFMRGRVNAAEGTTLRAFLSERLCCNPMRISKKLATGKIATTSIPKRLGSVTYHIQAADAATVRHTEQALERLRLTCFPAAPQHIQSRASLPSVQVTPSVNSTPRPAWHGRHYSPCQPTTLEDDRAMSPLHAGMKRMLPSSWTYHPPVGSSASLPPIVSPLDKRPRLLLHPTYH